MAVPGFRFDRSKFTIDASEFHRELDEAARYGKSITIAPSPDSYQNEYDFQTKRIKPQKNAFAPTPMSRTWHQAKLDAARADEAARHPVRDDCLLFSPGETNHPDFPDTSVRDVKQDIREVKAALKNLVQKLEEIL